MKALLNVLAKRNYSEELNESGLVIMASPFARTGKFDHQELSVDQAFLNVTSAATLRLFVYKLNDNCHQCPFERWLEVDPTTGHHSGPTKIDTAYGQSWRIFDRDLGPLVSVKNRWVI